MCCPSQTWGASAYLPDPDLAFNRSSGELPAIGAVVAQLRDLPVAELAHATTVNARQALPRLDALIARA